MGPRHERGGCPARTASVAADDGAAGGPGDLAGGHRAQPSDRPQLGAGARRHPVRLRRNHPRRARARSALPRALTDGLHAPVAARARGRASRRRSLRRARPSPLRAADPRLQTPRPAPRRADLRAPPSPAPRLVCRLLGGRLRGVRPRLAESFQEVVDSLPDDWTDLEFDLRLEDESRYIDAAVYLVTCNAQPYSRHDWHWRLLVPHRSGHAAAAPAVHGTLRLLDDAGIAGELAVREARSGRSEVVQMWG